MHGGAAQGVDHRGAVHTRQDIRMSGALFIYVVAGRVCHTNLMQQRVMPICICACVCMHMCCISIVCA